MVQTIAEELDIPSIEYVNFVFHFTSFNDETRNLFIDLVEVVVNRLKLPSAEVFTSPLDHNTINPADWNTNEYGMPNKGMKRSSASNIVPFLRSIEGMMGSTTVTGPRRGSKRPAFDYSWGVDLIPPPLSVPDPGVKYEEHGVLDTTIAISLSYSIVKSLPSTTQKNIIQTLVQTASRCTECYCGFVDCESEADTHGSWLYTDIVIEPLPRWIIEREESWWNLGMERRNRIKYIPWGLYLGRDMAARLREHWLSAVQDIRDWKPVSPPHITDHWCDMLDGESLFITLTGNVCDASPKHGFMHSLGNRGVQFGMWLKSRLAAHGMMT